MEKKIIPIFVEQQSPYANIRALEPIVESERRHVHVKGYPTIICQIGAGGTGSYTAVEIMKFISSQPDTVQDSIYYTLVDGDEFETKNIGRQLCSEEDVGVNKAKALIENYAPYFELKDDHVKYYDKYLTNFKDFTTIITDLNPTPLDKASLIIIDCVDRNLPRVIIDEYINTMKSFDYGIKWVYLISSGNGKYAGQVSWGRRLIRDCYCTSPYLSYSDNIISQENIKNRFYKKPNMNILVKDSEEDFNDDKYPSGIKAYNYALKSLDAADNKLFTRDMVTDLRMPIIDLNSNNRTSNIFTNVRTRKSIKYFNEFTYLCTMCDVPMPYDRYKELLDLSVDEEEDAMSCADRAIANFQSVFANKTASTFIINYLSSILGMMFPVTADIPTPIQSITSTFDCASCTYSSVAPELDIITNPEYARYDIAGNNNSDNNLNMF